MNELTDQLLGDAVDPYELIDLLERRYGMACRTGPRECIFPCTDSYTVKIRLEPGRIARIDPGPGFQPSEVESLKEVIRVELLDSPGDIIGRTVLFARRPVSGVFHSTVGLRILPAPADAPRPEVIDADHPFVLEFQLPRSANDSVTRMRWIRTGYEWTWILNVLLRPSVRYVGPQPRHLWALLPPYDAPFSYERLQYVQEFYMVTGFKGL